MIFPILFLLIGGFVTYLKTDDVEGEPRCIIVLTMSLIAGVLGMVLGLLVGANAPTERFMDWSNPIVSLKEEGNVKGDFFFLGSGTIGTDEYYYAYRVIGKDRYDKVKLNVYASEILESDKEPEMQVWKSRTKGSWKHFTLLVPKRRSYVLRVPHGTIIKKINGLD